MPVDSSQAASKDPYVESAQQDASPAQKVKEIQSIISSAKTCMFTTKTQDGTLHSRAMAPASKEAPFVFEFLANAESGKFDEMEHDKKVNISVYDSSSTNWISVAGKASITADESRIKEVWNPAVSAWFGDLGDGTHTGQPGDPRIQLIKVEPYEIRYWYMTRTQVGQLVDIAFSAVTGQTANPGVLRTLSKSELDQVKSSA